VPGSLPSAPSARWEPESGQWLDANATNGDLFGQSEPYSGRWPTSGTTLSGVLYPLGTPEHRTSVPGSSSQPGPLLLTPTSQLATNGGSQPPDKRREGGHGPTLADQVETELAGQRRLPTVSARDWKSGQSNLMGRGSRPLNEVIVNEVAPRLLPTPQATDSQGGPRALPERRTSRGKDHGPRLRDVAPALLPTPGASDWKGPGGTQGRQRNGRPRPAGDMDLPEAIGSLLPTVTASPSGRTGEQHMRMRRKMGRRTPSQLEAAVQLIGETTSPPSAGGKPSSAGPRPVQLSLDEPGAC
jgi:hypothetical protein